MFRARTEAACLAAIESGILRLKWLAAAARFELAMRKHAYALKAGFNPGQPRVPKGDPAGGQWSDTGAGGGISTGRARAYPSDLSAAKRNRADGHHYIHQALLKRWPNLSQEARDAFGAAKTG